MDDADYTLVLTTPVDEKGPMENRTPIEPGAINGGADAPFVGYTGAGLTIQVDSIDESLKKIEAEGGSVVKPRTSMGELGAYASSVSTRSRRSPRCFGVLAFMDGPRIAANEPTPWVGLTERICVGAYILWMFVLSGALLCTPGCSRLRAE
jgi:hypothetical protein